MKDKLGFDDGLNYKEEDDLKLALRRYFADGIDIYFDNMGGEMLEAVVANMNPYGRVTACGAISQFTDPSRKSAPDLIAIIYKSITIQGFFPVKLVDESWQLHIDDIGLPSCWPNAGA